MLIRIGFSWPWGQKVLKSPTSWILQTVLPIGSMYGIFTYIWLIFMVNVDIYIYHTWMVWAIHAYPGELWLLIPLIGRLGALPCEIGGGGGIDLLVQCDCHFRNLRVLPTWCLKTATETNSSSSTSTRACKPRQGRRGTICQGQKANSTDFKRTYWSGPLSRCQCFGNGVEFMWKISEFFKHSKNHFEGMKPELPELILNDFRVHLWYLESVYICWIWYSVSFLLIDF